VKDPRDISYIAELLGPHSNMMKFILSYNSDEMYPPTHNYTLPLISITKKISPLPSLHSHYNFPHLLSSPLCNEIYLIGFRTHYNFPVASLPV
jgi:hypothetical protein